MSTLAAAFDFFDFVSRWPYRLAEAVGVAVLKASLVMRRILMGSWSGGVCSTLVDCPGGKQTPVLYWPSILIDWSLSCHARGLAGMCTDCVSVTSCCIRSSDSFLTSGKKCLVDGRRKVGMASMLFRSYVSTIADFVTCVEFGRVDILVRAVAVPTRPGVTMLVT